MTIHSTNAQRGSIKQTQRAARALQQAEQLAERGQVSEAIRSVEQAIRLGADRYTCYLRLARLYQAGQQWEEAVCAAEMAIAEHPGKLSAREAIIALYLEAGEYQRAVEASKALLKLAPRHLPARDALGAAYIGLGDVLAAVRVANDLIRLNPYDPAHRFKKALLCQHQGEVRMAVEEFQRVLDISSDPEMTQNAREQLEVLDSIQLNAIIVLSEEDPIFRVKLQRDPDMSVEERGFYLSDAGRQFLRDWISRRLPEQEEDCRPRLYH
jgi:tetratricopeptide (TPR) repeat protein